MALSQVFFLLFSVYAYDSYELSPRTIRRFSKLLFVLLGLTGIFMAYPPMYEELDGAVRYQGIFSQGNTSANTFVMMSVMCWEYYKYNHRQSIFFKFLLFLLIVLTLAYCYTSGTRTLLFTLPYWFYQAYKYYNKTTLLGIMGLAAIANYSQIIDVITGRLRMNEDDHSYLTRAWLYDSQIEGILENYIIIPHGAHKAWDLARYITDDEGYSPHNDILCGLYEWGGAFIILIFALVRKFHKKNLINGETILILIAQSGTLLHNMWFSFIVWIPLILIIILKNQQNIISYEHVSPCKKI